MLKISDTIEQLLAKDIEIQHVLKLDCLNLSAYAKRIQPEVEQMVKKDVRIGSIVIALARIRKQLSTSKALYPPPTAMELSVRSGLVEVVYERTTDNVTRFNSAQKQLQTTTDDFLIATQGIAEITLIANLEKLPALKKEFNGIKPKFELGPLSALTVRSTSKDIFTPNVFFSILKPFAIEQINIIEIVSTFTEITLIFEQKDVQKGFRILEKFL
jgi:hypothetical protein